MLLNADNITIDTATDGCTGLPCNSFYSRMTLPNGTVFHGDHRPTVTGAYRVIVRKLHEAGHTLRRRTTKVLATWHGKTLPGNTVNIIADVELSSDRLQWVRDEIIRVLARVRVGHGYKMTAARVARVKKQYNAQLAQVEAEIARRQKAA